MADVSRLSVRSQKNSIALLPLTAKPKVLIVDDEERQVGALRAILRREGYDAIGVTSGEAAIAQLRISKFPLLLTDLQMPGLDGIARCARA